MTNEKYLIYVDFPDESIVHLNPLLYQTSSNCKTGVKNPEHGGLILATEEEVSNYLYLFSFASFWYMAAYFVHVSCQT